LQSEPEKSARDLTAPIRRINRANAAFRFGTGTISDALAEREVLKIRYNAFRQLANAASTSQNRTTRPEVKFIAAVSVAAIQRKADELAQEYRELDTRIQEADSTPTLTAYAPHGVQTYVAE
jgi:site-specific recombinase